MKIGTQVVYFFAATHDLAGKVILGTVYKRPTSFPTVELFVCDPSGTIQFLGDPIPHGGSLQECLEIGNKWISFDEAEAFGIDLEDGDQDLTQISV